MYRQISFVLENFPAYRGGTTRLRITKTASGIARRFIPHGDRSRIIRNLRDTDADDDQSGVLIRRVGSCDFAFDPRLESRDFAFRDLSGILAESLIFSIMPLSHRTGTASVISAMRTFLISYSIINPLVISDYFRCADEMTSCHRLV